uniref:CheR-type methyltransferase domain-containing protein n=1 Tax=uncultured bacterium esnapd2 TaxID=1366601 RepID=S5UAL5_9BACT|nr:hypothetical protein [uncultured bacterium esnapd2]
MWYVVQIVDRWNTAYFDGRLSAGVLARLRALAGAPQDALALADRAFRLMRAAGLRPADLSVFTAWLIGSSVPGTVPSAWSGAVPPVTMAGRHRALDEYVARNPWHRPEGRGVFVDIGCGSPPVTTLDTARRLGDWRVIGVDPALGDAKVIQEALRQCENGNLELFGGGIGEFTVDGGADVIRCMNVLMYFDHPFREKALSWAAAMLRPGGLLLCGSNWIDSASSRYTVYRKEKDRLVGKEFAFSADNIRPIELAPWYGLHDDNLENLANAHAVGTVRADTPFRRRFDKRMDALLADLNMCPRDADGNLGNAPDDMPADIRGRCSALLASHLDDEGFVGEAVDVLRRSGRHAWRNHVGHVAMRPVTPPPLAPSSVFDRLR